MSKYHLTRVSRNAKTGPLPVVTASKDTCPDTCTLKGAGCYAEHGPIALHWNRVDREGISFDELLEQIKTLPRKQLWRYGQAGDLPTDPEQAIALAKANRKRAAIVFTHGRNFALYAKLEKLGFHINLSSDNLHQADELAKSGLSVVTVLPSSFQKRDDETLSEFRHRVGQVYTPAGHRVAICPATYTDTNCASCGACSKRRPGGTMIGFPAHGTRKRLIDKSLELRVNTE